PRSGAASIPMRCATRSPPTWSKAAPTCATSRRCSATRRSRPRRSTPRSTASASWPFTASSTPAVEVFRKTFHRRPDGIHNTMMSVLLLALLTQQVPTETQVDAAWRKLKEECAKTDVPARVAAIKEALQTHHEKIIKAMEELLKGDSDAVRMAIAETLVTVDHPATADVLIACLASNYKKTDVAKAILRSIGELGYETAASKLNDLIGRYGDGE